MIHMDNQENFENLRVASFSSYLNSSEENFVLKLTGATKDQVFDLISPEETPSLASVEKGKTDHECEIAIFGADKYFNLRMEQENPKLTNFSKINSAKVFTRQNSIRAPSILSEASSYSQRALLPKLLKTPSLVKQRTGSVRRFFSGFGCNGPCSNKKSVHINKGVENDGSVHKKDHPSESFRFANTIVFDGPKNCQAIINGGEQFEFPVPKSGKEDLVVKKWVEEENDEVPRHSIEVFGSGMIKITDQVERNLERKLSMLTWDAIPKTLNQASLTMESGGPFDDNQSDASSDLFEIEALSGNINTFSTNQGCEKVACCMSPTTQYAPSEASIEWSVVTASAADFSFTSEFHEKYLSQDSIPKPSKTKKGGLLGCKSQKAVSVAETAYKITDKAKIVAERKLQGPVISSDFGFVTI